MREYSDDDDARPGIPIGIIPEIFADAVEINAGIYGIALNFGLNYPRGQGRTPLVRPQARVHLSPQLAKVLGQLLQKTMRTYEAEIGHITIPAELLRQLGLEEEPQQ